MKDPNSQDAEKAVLGAVLGDAEAFLKVKRLVKPEDFYNSEHQKIFQAMLDVHAAGLSVDLVTVSARLKDIGKKIGAGYLAELSDDCPSSANVKHWADIVKNKAKLRRIVEGARDIAKQATDPGADPRDIPTKLSIEVNHDAEVNQVSTVIKSLNENIKNGYPGLPPCYDLLARTIRKVCPGHLWIVGGYTSTGKSAFLVDMIVRMYRNGLYNPGIAVFSTEMSCEQYLVRALSNYTTIPGWTITEKKMNPQQEALLVQAQVFFSQRNLYLYDRLYKIEEIENTARMLKENGLDIIAIDYIQNLWGDGKIYDRMSRLAPLLQYLAKDLQVTIIALSQVSNEHVKDAGKSGVYGYKGAGEIAASADLGIELERDRDNDERMIFKVEKNRHGCRGEGVLRYIHNFVRLKEEIEEGQ